MEFRLKNKGVCSHIIHRYAQSMPSSKVHSIITFILGVSDSGTIGEDSAHIYLSGGDSWRGAGEWVAATAGRTKLVEDPSEGSRQTNMDTTETNCMGT